MVLFNLFYKFVSIVTLIINLNKMSRKSKYQLKLESYLNAARMEQSELNLLNSVFDSMKHLKENKTLSEALKLANEENSQALKDLNLKIKGLDRVRTSKKKPSKELIK